MDASGPPTAQSFAELVSDGPRMTIKPDELRKEPPKTEIKPTRFIRRCRQKLILQFAEIFEEFKVEYGDLIKSYGNQIPPEFSLKCKGYFATKWKSFCDKWNKRKGFPKVDPDLFNKQANKYLNELRTVQASQAAE